MEKRRLAIMIAGALLMVMTGLSTRSSAGVNVNIGIGVPLPISIPPLVFSSAPSVVVIPGSYVYYAPDADADLLFYEGYWYRPHDGGWYRCRSYDGPWAYLAPSRVPRALMDLPSDYRGRAHVGRRIAYAQLRRNWGRWERERYWDRREEGAPMGRMGHMGRGNDD